MFFPTTPYDWKAHAKREPRLEINAASMTREVRHDEGCVLDKHDDLVINTVDVFHPIHADRIISGIQYANLETNFVCRFKPFIEGNYIQF